MFQTRRPKMHLHILLLMLCMLNGTSARLRGGRVRGCPEERGRGARGEVVVTGTVRRLVGGTQEAEVIVKRVLRGAGGLRAGESLLVAGFGDPSFCNSRVEAKDSRIFFLDQLETGRFRLSASPLRVNVANLDKVTAAVKGTPYRRRAPIVDEPCEKKYCKINGDCHEDKRSGPRCRCPQSCAEHYSPVCASNGLTYNTECHMRIESCRNSKAIYVRHVGVCRNR